MTFARPLLTVLAVLALMLAGCGGAQSRLAHHMRRGQEYFDSGNYPKARIEFGNAMQIAPNDPTARVMAGRTAERQGQFNVALGLYQSVVSLNPGNVDARASLARLLTLAGQPQQAFDLLKPALASHPDDVRVLTVLAVARLGLKDEAGALAAADRAVTLAPADEDAVALRAGLYQRSGELPRAVTLVETAARRAPHSVAFCELLVSLYAAGNQPRQAEQQLRKLIDLQPAVDRYRNQLAALYMADGRTDDAQRVLEDSVKALPASLTPKVALVDFLATYRSSGQAEHALQGFIAREPDNYDLGLLLGTLRERSGRVADADSAYADVVQRAGPAPAGLVARDRQARIAFDAGHYPQASRLVAEVLQKNPRDDAALTLRGRMALTRHDPQSAIADFRTVLRDQPRAVPVQRLLAQALLQNGEPELAIEALRAAHDAMPTDASLTITLAQLLQRTGRAEDAIGLLVPAARAAPADSSLQEALAAAYLGRQDFSGAAAVADRLKEIHPQGAAGFYFAGLAQQGNKQFDAAQKEFEQALVLQPRSAEVLAALAHLELARGRGDEATARVRSAAEHDNSAYSWNLLGELYLAQREYRQAREALARAVQLTPQWWIPYRNLALERVAAGDLGGALAQYDRGIAAAPSEAGLAIEAATLLEKQGRIDQAIERYHNAVRANPDSRPLANNLAMMLVTYRKDRGSLDAARALTQSFDDSSDGDLLDTSGWVHFKRAEYAEALPALERAAQHLPGSQVIRYHLGMAELQAGRTQQARADLQAAIAGGSTFPGSEEARSTLASLQSKSG